MLVKFTNKKFGKFYQIYLTVLNTGSNLTFCSQELVDRLGLEPLEHKKDINTMGKCVGQTYGYLTLEVQSLQEKHYLQIPACSYLPYAGTLER